MSYRNWTDQDLEIAVKNSNTKSQVLRLLGLKTNSSGNFQTVDKHIKRLNLDTVHFKSEIFGRLSSRERDIKEILVENSTYTNTPALKKKLLKLNLLEYKCYDLDCGIVEWHGKKLSLQIDHINGDRSDNRIENLRLLCPNCHSLTSTFCRGSKRIKSKNKCIDCDVVISDRHIRCMPCDGLSKRNKKQKIEWPPLATLITMVENLGYVEVGRNLGVTDNSVRKRITTRLQEFQKQLKVKLKPFFTSIDFDEISKGIDRFYFPSEILNILGEEDLDLISKLPETLYVGNGSNQRMPSK